MHTTNSYNPDVLNCIANLSNDEVFTPPTLANQVLDLLPQVLFKSPKTKFLDPFSKSGVFLREIVKRLDIGLEGVIPDRQKRIDHILHNQVYGIACTELTSLLSRRSVYCSKTADGQYSVSKFDRPEGNIQYKAIKHTWKDGKCKYCGASQAVYDRGNEAEQYAYQFIHTDNPSQFFGNMTFDVIIGNPPYQLNDGGGTGSSAMPLYHKFVEQAKRLDPRYLTMIIPSRWFSGGKGLDEFRDAMLHDNHIREIHDFGNAGDCFPGVAIEGGVCYFLWNRDQEGLCKVYSHSGNQITAMSERPLLEKGADVFIRYNEVISIIRKVAEFNEDSFSSLVSPRNPYNIHASFENSQRKIGTCDVLGIESGQRVYKKMDKACVGRNNEELFKYKLFISKADGAAGQIGYPVPARILGKSEIAGINTACTETFLRIGPFDDVETCFNVKSYIETKFFRCLVGARKNKNMTQSTYSFVPIQDFSHPWTDEMLYEKYHLDKDEIEFIESMIRPME